MSARKLWTKRALREWASDVDFGLEFVERSEASAEQLPDSIIPLHHAAVTALKDLIAMIEAEAK